MPQKALALSVTHRGPKGRKLISIVETAYDKAGLTAEEAQRVNDTPGLAGLINSFIEENRRVKNGAPYLRLLTQEPLVIDPTDGSRIIADASNAFPGGIDPNFRKRASEAGKPTEKTLVKVYEMIQDATFTQMFNALAADVSRLCLTQSQIIEFVEAHRDQLQGGFAGQTYFLFRSYNQLFVAYVEFSSSGCGPLAAGLRDFEYIYSWSHDAQCRVVVPQLA